LKGHYGNPIEDNLSFGGGHPRVITVMTAGHDGQKEAEGHEKSSGRTE